jgi:hypothetical protein
MRDLKWRPGALKLRAAIFVSDPEVAIFVWVRATIRNWQINPKKFVLH